MTDMADMSAPVPFSFSYLSSLEVACLQFSSIIHRRTTIFSVRKYIGYIFQRNHWTEHWTANQMSENRQWHTGRCSGGLVVGLHGEEVAEPGLLAKGEPDEVAPDLVAHLAVIIINYKIVES